ncbi:hypothetical protein I2I11_20180 [Pontibacter sp. 172403-2]|uniref:hypothetical protein n=1 Tax=Pontibacter rufus TaxID=2791028 RepID=UPI0018AF97D8|nr:hypothetical protein [Pontibacter sp. 172403-2]MBF9255626.1 hypothetical protein [Pontibacter sp. 172403-2]
MKKLIALLPLILLFNVCLAQTSEDFIAMEYRGMSNLIYKIHVTPDRIVGLRVNGYISVKNSYGIGYTVPDNELNNPGAYVNKNLESAYSGIDIDSAAILRLDEENFIIEKSAIKELYHSKKKKFGMGSYPYSGRIIIKCNKTKGNARGNRDLILVGEQDWQSILELMR